MASSSIPKVLREFGSTKFDMAAMEKFAGAEVAERFKQALVDGSKTLPEDSKALEQAIFEWCSSQG